MKLIHAFLLILSIIFEKGFSKIGVSFFWIQIEDKSLMNKISMKIIIALLVVLAVYCEDCPDPTLGYNKDIAAYAANYATCANVLTKFEDRIKDWVYEPCTKAQDISKVSNIVIIKNTDTAIFGYAAYDLARKVIVLGFRGTICQNNNQNIDTDAAVELVDYKDWQCRLCKVHKGFLEAYHSVRQQVHTEVVALAKLHSDSPLLITGISLGGALAALASYDLINYLPTQNLKVTIQSYTFGQPRIGNKRFVKSIDQHLTVYRVVYSADPVPHMPVRMLNNISLSYFNPGVEIFYPLNKQTAEVCRGDNEHCSLNRYESHELCHHLYYPELNLVNIHFQLKNCAVDYRMGGKQFKEAFLVSTFLISYCKLLCSGGAMPDCLNYPEELTCEKVSKLETAFSFITNIVSSEAKAEEKLKICEMKLCKDNNAKKMTERVEPTNEEEL